MAGPQSETAPTKPSSDGRVLCLKNSRRLLRILVCTDSGAGPMLALKIGRLWKFKKMEFAEGARQGGVRETSGEHDGKE